MAGNSRPSFSKRQKERARQERQAEKQRKRALRKQEKEETAPARRETPVIAYDEEGNPQGLGFHDFWR